MVIQPRLAAPASPTWVIIPVSLRTGQAATTRGLDDVTGFHAYFKAFQSLEMSYCERRPLTARPLPICPWASTIGSEKPRLP